MDMYNLLELCYKGGVSMYEGFFMKTGGVMAEDVYGFFMAALKHELSRQDMPQTVLAVKAGVSDKHLNAVFKGRSGKGGRQIRAGIKLQQNIAEVFGYKLVEFLQLGEQVSTGAIVGVVKKEISMDHTSIPGVEANHIDPMAVLSRLTAASAGVQVLVDQYQKNDARMRYWQAIFENLPASVVVIKDGIVYSQNIKSRDLEIITGKPFCENCAGETCENKDICPVHIAATMAKPASGYKIIKDALYKLDVEYVGLNDHEYLIILATETKGDMVPFNRRKTDRRKENQEDGE